MKRTYKGKKAPKGYHYMAGGKLMKDSAHARTKRRKRTRTKKRR